MPLGAWHGGSHPFLVYEFVRSIVEGREAHVNAAKAAAWTAPGLVAHESAMRGGEALEVPAQRLAGPAAELLVVGRVSGR